MGYYFEVHIKVKLVKTLPVKIVTLLSKWITENNWEGDEALPDHRLFTLQRWSSVFYHSMYHDPPSFVVLKHGYYQLILNGEINYGGEEIQAFNEWISPYVAGRKLIQFIGWYKGESYEVPRINLYRL